MRWNTNEGINGESKAMRLLAARVERVSTSELPVLITGETGTGKELVARAIHARSSRHAGPFVSENCAALADTLLEAELFGHESGAFTGATNRRDGLFAHANGGTLFIDEIGDMSEPMQAKLLRVLQEGEIRRLGGNEVEKIDVRIIAATHKNLDELVAAGRFRQDLLFRLAVLEVQVPPLRDRLSDLPRLATHFLDKLNSEEGRELVLCDEALDRLLSHDWPGNVRELENAIRVGALFSSGPVLEADSLPIHPALSRVIGYGDDLNLSYQELLDSNDSRERNYICTILANAKGNKAEAARRLGITRYALYRTMKRLNINADEDYMNQRQVALSA